jgi:hypothetical protein
MRTWIAVFALLGAAPAVADEVILRSGARFSGIVSRSPGRVTVEMDAGTMTFAAMDVAAVRRTAEPRVELEQKMLKAEAAADWHAAAVFASSNGLNSRVAELHAKAVEVDPDHEASRAALGYRKLDGLWLRGDALMAAQGLVRRGDAWMSPEAAARHDADAARAVEAERVLEAKAAQAERTLQDLQAEAARRAEAERDALELARNDVANERESLAREREAQALSLERTRKPRRAPAEINSYNLGPYEDPYRNAYWHAEGHPGLSASCPCWCTTPFQTTTRGGPSLRVK